MTRKVKKLYSTVELANALGVTKGRIHQMIGEGKITPSYKVGITSGFTAPVFNYYVDKFGGRNDAKK